MHRTVVAIAMALSPGFAATIGQAQAPTPPTPPASAPPGHVVEGPSGPTAPPLIDDPQLAPPPQAARTLRSWEEAIALLRTQSPDLRAVHDNVLRAEAQARVALEHRSG